MKGIAEAVLDPESDSDVEKVRPRQGDVSNKAKVAVQLKRKMKAAHEAPSLGSANVGG